MTEKIAAMNTKDAHSSPRGEQNTSEKGIITNAENTVITPSTSSHSARREESKKRAVKQPPPEMCPRHFHVAKHSGSLYQAVPDPYEKGRDPVECRCCGGYRDECAAEEDIKEAAAKRLK